MSIYHSLSFHHRSKFGRPSIRPFPVAGASWQEMRIILVSSSQTWARARLALIFLLDRGPCSWCYRWIFDTVIDLRLFFHLEVTITLVIWLLAYADIASMPLNGVSFIFMSQ